MLTSGTRLGPYEILAAIGAGGMGEVYRGRDTRLERTVAIKILPEALAGDPQFRERFDREARAISQLDHPHICALYDIGEHPSTGSGPAIAYLVMQYLEGETLADRLAKGALPFDQALRTAIEIAGALDKAHRSGIVHRDLKPANVMLTKAGAKLLDFGLAKSTGVGRILASGPAGSKEQDPAYVPTALPTTPANLTMQGAIIGTFQYMAPEQLEGKEADARTDIFAFGALLYEMVTGRKAFEGKSQASLISAIMASEPAPVSSVQALAPSTLDQIVRTCLAKDPDDRWQTAADVERQLKWIAEGRSQAGATTQAPAVAPVRRTKSRTFAVAAVSGLAGALVAAAVLWSWGGNAPASPASSRVSVMLPANRPVAFLGFPVKSLALSPDGTELVYVGTNLDAPADQPGGRAQLQLRSLSTLAVRDLPGTTGARQPFFSPDGQWVGFFTVAGALKKISLAGGNPVTLLEKIDGSQWGFGTWTEDNTIIFGTPGSDGLRRVPADGGEATPLTTSDAAQGEQSHLYPALVPPARAVLFGVRYSQLRNPRIEAVMLDSGERGVVVENADTPLVLSSGHLLFRRDEAILIAPFDTDGLTLTGPAVPLIDEVRAEAATPFPVPQLAVSRSGTLAYVPAIDTTRALGLVGREGSFERLGPPPNNFGVPRVSPNGQYVAFVVSGGQESEVHVYDLVRGNTTKLTQDGSDRGSEWYPDGRSLAVTSVRPNASGLFLKNLDGSERILVARPADGAFLRSSSWSPDGKLLAYTTQTGSQHDIWVLTMGDTPTTKPFLNSAASEYSPRFSPDGRWLAYQSDESGRQEVYVRRYPTGERFAVSTGGGNGPVWRPDGREIFFQGPYEGVPKLMAVSVTSERDSLRLAKPVPLFDMRVSGPSGVIEQYANSNNSGPNYDILPDGQRFVMIRGADPQGTREIVLVQNWFEELKRLVPVK